MSFVLLAAEGQIIKKLYPPVVGKLPVAASSASLRTISGKGEARKTSRWPVVYRSPMDEGRQGRNIFHPGKQSIATQLA